MKQQMTTAAWVSTIIAVISLSLAIGLGARGMYYQHQVEQMDSEVIADHATILVMQNDIATIKADVKDVKSALGIVQGKGSHGISFMLEKEGSP